MQDVFLAQLVVKSKPSLFHNKCRSNQQRYTEDERSNMFTLHPVIMLTRILDNCFFGERLVDINVFIVYFQNIQLLTGSVDITQTNLKCCLTIHID